MSARALLVPDRAAIYLLGVGIGYGSLAQGGFYPAQFVVMAALVLAAAFVSAVCRRNRPPHLAVVFGGSLMCLAAWAAVRADGSREGAGVVLLCLTVAAALYVACGLQHHSQQLFVNAVIALGVLVALTSYVGVAAHHTRWAAPSQGLWRGASTLTYANAAAAFLAAPLLLSLQRAMAKRTLMRLCLVWILGVGWLATLSRGAALGLLVALLVFIAITTGRKRVLKLWPVIPAVVVTYASLIPSLPEGRSPSELLAVAGLGAGVLVLWMLSRPRAAALVVLALVAAMFVGALDNRDVFVSALHRVQETRLNTQSSDRSDLSAETWRQFRLRPMVGVGPNNFRLAYVNHAGQYVVAHYTHNEFLQLAAELGVIALGLVATAWVALIAMAARNWRRNRERAAVALAIGAAFAVQSSLDFLWHIPVLPLTTAALIGTLATMRGDSAAE